MKNMILVLLLLSSLKVNAGEVSEQVTSGEILKTEYLKLLNENGKLDEYTLVEVHTTFHHCSAKLEKGSNISFDSYGNGKKSIVIDYRVRYDSTQKIFCFLPWIKNDVILLKGHQPRKKLSLVFLK